MAQIILESGYQVVEGLIVDTKDGGICFQNHAVPVGQPLGGQWKEDLLCIYADTSCTDTNLTLHFSRINVPVKGYLRDDGGFPHLSPDVPVPNWSVNYTWHDVGLEPDFGHCSYTEA